MARDKREHDAVQPEPDEPQAAAEPELDELEQPVDADVTPEPEEPTTPSALALAAVGNLDGEDVEPGDVARANEHGEAYQAEKRKHRWG